MSQLLIKFRILSCASQDMTFSAGDMENLSLGKGIADTSQPWPI